MFPTSCLTPGALGLGATVPGFMWALEIRTRDLMPSPQPFTCLITVHKADTPEREHLGLES